MSKKLINKARGLSDKAIAWIFITPTVLLLLAINIYPLFYAISMSFTNFYANKIGKEIKWVGLKNYIKVLGKESVWERMQITANFMFWTLLIQALIGLGLALLLNKKFKGNELLTTLIVLPMMLSPAVVGTFWTYLYNPQVGVFSYIMNFFYNFGPIDMIGSSVLAPWSIVIVDTWMWTPFTMLICLAGLRSIPDYLYEAAEVDRASRWQQFIYITLPSVLPFLLLALLFRGIENFKMFDMVVELTSGGPGSATELASIQLKREAFEKWKTGYSSAYAVILFVTIFGFGNVYVKVMNKIKDR
ncbi:MAG: sugar ABC transporter permease [Pelagibacteraceae bacterium]|jgi:multiple sugar transport system permease protein|nr:sugar ABC transporter permease [Pelagibacteraceae bacterium]MBO6468503.1 sugar ABC transporter permease [Pelagibacteraceae bacterium]MBO6478391.1 sugar ABC transporter permease [Pelagibacteraceae bacterium]MDP6784119.1 sugar ABC transporter permease [Alphaproteobacteria bacterium]HJL57777.1 sugar ABC transporter permease [Alphaproteobacteria bacterium]